MLVLLLFGLTPDLCFLNQQEKKARQNLQVKLSMAKFLQDALEETAVQIKGKQGTALKEFATFIEEVCVYVCTL